MPIAKDIRTYAATRLLSGIRHDDKDYICYCQGNAMLATTSDPEELG